MRAGEPLALRNGLAAELNHSGHKTASVPSVIICRIENAKSKSKGNVQSLTRLSSISKRFGELVA